MNSPIDLLVIGGGINGAGIARDAGKRVVDVRGFGERRPRAAGNSAAAYAQNRRVEIYCIK